MSATTTRLVRRYGPLLGLLLVQLVAAAYAPSRAPAAQRPPALDVPAASTGTTP